MRPTLSPMPGAILRPTVNDRTCSIRPIRCTDQTRSPGKGAARTRVRGIARRRTPGALRLPGLRWLRRLRKVTVKKKVPSGTRLRRYRTILALRHP